MADYVSRQSGFISHVLKQLFLSVVQLGLYFGPYAQTMDILCLLGLRHVFSVRVKMDQSENSNSR